MKLRQTWFLLAGLLLVAGPAGCGGQTEEQAVIEKRGGRVQYDDNNKEMLMIDLISTEVTDAELEHLKGLTNLQTLYLTNNQITDAGLEHLKGLTKLETLYLNNPQITDEAVKKLQQALPNCEINH